MVHIRWISKRKQQYKNPELNLITGQVLAVNIEEEQTLKQCTRNYCVATGHHEVLQIGNKWRLLKSIRHLK